MKKRIVLLSIFVLSLALFVISGVTIAYLIDTSATITNIFDPQNIDVELVETTTTYKMIPGCKVDKDPVVSIDTDIACYVFIEIKETSNIWDSNIVVDWKSNIDTDWNQVPGQSNVYYREIAANVNTSFAVFTGNKVDISNHITKEYMDGLENLSIPKPVVTITAYATQKLKDASNSFTPAEAWALITP